MKASKNDYGVLGLLYDDDCTTEIKSYTLKKLSEITGLSVSKLRITVKLFKPLGYIQEGAMSHKANTYYITEKGIKKIKQLGGIN